VNKPNVNIVASYCRRDDGGYDITRVCMCADDDDYKKSLFCCLMRNFRLCRAGLPDGTFSNQKFQFE
jgi:hypothetical protein